MTIAPCDDIPECSSDPCQNGATCNEADGTFTCTCATGFSGSLCQHNIACDSNPCDRGDCLALPDGTYNCTCEPGYEGLSYCYSLSRFSMWLTCIPIQHFENLNWNSFYFQTPFVRLRLMLVQMIHVLPQELRAASVTKAILSVSVNLDSLETPAR